MRPERPSLSRDDSPAGDCARFNARLLPLQDRLYTLAVLLLGDAAGAAAAVDQACREAFSAGCPEEGAAFREALFACLVRACRARRPGALVSQPGGRGLDPGECLARLPFELRAVVALVDREGFSYAETARILRCGRRAVLQRLASARRALIPMMGV